MSARAISTPNVVCRYHRDALRLLFFHHQPVSSRLLNFNDWPRAECDRGCEYLLGVQKASFVSPAEMVALTGMEVGGVTPFSLPAGVMLYVDEQVMNPD
jgi:hypothetical protein